MNCSRCVCNNAVAGLLAEVSFFRVARVLSEKTRAAVCVEIYLKTIINETLTEPKVSKTSENTKLIFDAILLCKEKRRKRGKENVVDHW